MTPPDLRIRLHRADGRYRPGEPITGDVISRVDEACECGGLTVTTRLTVTPERSRPRVHDDQPFVIFNGPWQSGEHTHPFTLPAPTQPFDYRGQTLSLSWSVHATAQMPMARDPEAEHDIALVPPDGARVELHYWGGKLQLPSGREGRLFVHVLLGGGWIALTTLVARALLRHDFAWTDGILAGLALVVFGCHVLIVIGGFIKTELPGYRDPPDLGPDVNELVIGPAGAPSGLCVLARFVLKRAGGEGYRHAPPADQGYDFIIGVSPQVGLAAIEASLEVDEVVTVWVERANQSRKKSEERTHCLLATPVLMKATERPGVYAGRVVPPEPGRVPYGWGKDGTAIRWRLAVTATPPGGEAPFTGRVRLVAKPTESTGAAPS